jgi:AraC family transcriptional regulator of adaptative response / DNA-3-methyladenine glycosylase II
LLDTTELSMLDVALGSGFGSVWRFNAVFRAIYGRSPTELRQKRGAARRA